MEQGQGGGDGPGCDHTPPTVQGDLEVEGNGTQLLALDL